MEDKKKKQTGQQEPSDFKIFSSKAYSSEGEGQPQVIGIGSSECVDLVGDIIELSALNDIRQLGVGSPIFIDHKSDQVPESVFGAMAYTPEVKLFTPNTHGVLKSQKPFAAVELTANVAQSNKRAMDSYNLITQDGVALGFSVSFKIADYEVMKDAAGGPTGFRILHLVPLEESIVGIPCNQQCFISDAGNSIKSVNMEHLSKGIVSYQAPDFPTTDTNWAMAAAKGIYKRYGQPLQFNDEADFLYHRKNYRDFDEVTSTYLKQLSIVLERWGLGIGDLPQE